MKRNYVAWYKLKAEIEHKREAPEFSERDVWWCSIGANIGFEEDGKSLEAGFSFSRDSKDDRTMLPVHVEEYRHVVVSSFAGCFIKGESGQA